jgi:uncharacterized membrane protein YfcA
MIWIAAYLALGASAGFLAGLLGVGGGAVMVPVLVMLFSAQGYPEQHVLHLALGTSLATIIFTSLSSLRAHHRRGAVLWPIVRNITPGIVLGTWVGAAVVARLSTRPLALFFALFISIVALQMLIDMRPRATRQMPGRWGMWIAGGVIGTVSALVAIGGGSLSVPFMTWCNIKIHQAIGTSAAIGFPIALAGSLGYLVAGTQAVSLPAGTAGFIDLRALFPLAAASTLIAPWGARVAHRLPVQTLKKIFALLLILLATKMFFSLPA